MGNTSKTVLSTAGSPVHPHTHGEHFCRINLIITVCGSSPHAWGTPYYYINCCILFRFIPTRMGNTLYSSNSNSPRSVHPHTHGEHAPHSLDSAYRIGSSPHAWGTQYIAYAEKPGYRFIPTRMGNTLYNLVKITASFGSSPHAWGTLAIIVVEIAADRFIPTRMGNTI